jgi:hypothetical protein
MAHSCCITPPLPLGLAPPAHMSMPKEDDVARQTIDVYFSCQRPTGAV